MPPFQNPSYHTLGTRQQVPSPYRICVPLTDLTPIFFLLGGDFLSPELPLRFTITSCSRILDPFLIIAGDV